MHKSDERMKNYYDGMIVEENGDEIHNTQQAGVLQDNELDK